MSANSLAQTRVGWRKGRLDGRTSLLFRQALGRPWNPPPTIEGLLRTTLRSLPPTNKSQPKRVRKPPKLLGLSSRERAVALVGQAAAEVGLWLPHHPHSASVASPRTHASSRSLYCSRSGTQPTVFLRRLGSQDCRVPHRSSRGWCCSQVCPRSFAPGLVPFFFGCTVLPTGP